MSEKKNFKCWRATKDSKAGMMVTPDMVAMAADNQNFIAVTKDGIALSGPVSFVGSGENIRMDGLFAQAPSFTRMIPSSMVTAHGEVVPSPPMAYINTIRKSLPMLEALMVS